MQRPSIVGALLLCLFGLPFAGFGLFFAVATGLKQTNGPQGWGGILFGCAFALIGFGLMAAAVFGYRKAKQEADLQDAHRDAPWLWKADWAAGRADGSSPAANVATWVFAAVWDAISFPVAASILPKQLQQGDLRVLLVALFPLIGIAITGFAIRGTLRALRYGRTFFAIDSAPFLPGARLKGAIHLKPPSDLPHGFDLTLSCKRRIVTGSGKNQSVHELVLWQDSKNVPAEYVACGPDGAQVQAEFSLPEDAYETCEDNANDRVYWQLNARADVPGVDFADNYELPVFRTQPAPGAQREDDSSAGDRGQLREEPEIAAPAETHIVFRQDVSGPSFYFPPLRNHAQAAAVVLFAAVWSAVVYLLWTRADAPWVFRIVFSLAEVLVGYMLLSVVFGSALLRVRDGALEIRNAILGLGAMQRIPIADVASIVPLSQGEAGVSANVMFGVLVRRGDGREIKIANGSLREREAKWVVATLERAMGRKQDTRVEFRSIYGPPPQRGTPAQSHALPTLAAANLPLKTRSAQRVVGLFGFAIWLLFALPFFGGVFRMGRRLASPAPSRTRQASPADLGNSVAQQQAEVLLERSVQHDARALEGFEAKIEGWTGQVRLTDRMKELEWRSRFSRDLRVRQANVDLNLAAEGWRRNQEAVDELMKRAKGDARSRSYAYYYLGMEGARGVDAQRVFTFLSDRALHDEDAAARQSAVEGLRFFKTDEALEVLYQSFTADPSFAVRDRAGCNVSDCGIFTRAQRMRYVPRLIELSGDPTLAPQMRSWVFLALGEITDASNPTDSRAWQRWYEQHGAEKMQQAAALPWYEVRGDQ